MAIDEATLIEILRIAHESSMRGSGISMHDAIARSGYSRVRKELRAPDLVALIRADPGLVEQWLQYSEDKRTPGGYWITHDRLAIGEHESREITRFDLPEQTVAEFVVREIAFWFRVGRSTAV